MSHKKQQEKMQEKYKALQRRNSSRRTNLIGRRLFRCHYAAYLAELNNQVNEKFTNLQEAVKDIQETIRSKTTKNPITTRFPVPSTSSSI